MSEMQVIKVDSEVYERLKLDAEAFVDTPNSVLRRLLALDPKRARTPESGVTRSRKSTKTRRPTTGSGKARVARNRRAPVGSILPEHEYVLPILVALEDGSAPCGEVIKTVGQILKNRLTPMDKKKLSGGSVRWKNRVQFARINLIDRGLLVRNSPRGIWEISEKGQPALDELDGFKVILLHCLKTKFGGTGPADEVLNEATKQLGDRLSRLQRQEIAPHVDLFGETRFFFHGLGDDIVEKTGKPPCWSLTAEGEGVLEASLS